MLFLVNVLGVLIFSWDTEVLGVLNMCVLLRVSLERSAWEKKKKEAGDGKKVESGEHNWRTNSTVYLHTTPFE